MIFEYTPSTTERGVNHMFAIADRRLALFFGTALSGHRIMGGPFKGLDDSTASVGEALGRQASDLTEAGLRKLFDQLVEQRLKPSFATAQQAIPVASKDHAGRLALFNQPHFPDDVPPAVRVEQRQGARPLSLDQLMRDTQSDPALAAAIVEGGLSLSKLPPDIFDRLRRDMAIENATTRLLSQRTYRTAPTPDDPVGGKPDVDAARRDGAALIAALEAEAELIEGAPQALAQVVALVALLANVTRDEALKMLTA